MQRKFLRILIMLLLMVNTIHAQLCQGSLGDPIINTTFGSGANPGQSLAAATTAYQYVPNDCPNDGFYTVRNNSSSCFGNSWHNLNADHTGNSNGYFMLVNASYQPSAFYLDTVKGLCSNSTYEFAAWIMNVALPSNCGGNSIKPDLTFSIEKTDGSTLQVFNTGTIQETQAPTWKQYGFFFTTPVAVTDVVLRIFNNAQGGCGNDLALDDITFRPCGPGLTPAIQGFAGNTVSYCEGLQSNYTLSCAVSGGFVNPEFQWQRSIDDGLWTNLPAQAATSLTLNFPAATAPGKYAYRMLVAEAGNMSSIQCRIASAPLIIRINPKPVITVTNGSPVCERTTLNLSAAGGSVYAWTGPGGSVFDNPQVVISNIQLNQAGKYVVTVTSDSGCVAKDSALVIVNPVPAGNVWPVQVNICAGDSIKLTASGGGTYAWFPANWISDTSSASPVASPPATITYAVVITNGFNCRDTAFANIDVYTKPGADAGPDRVMILGQSVQLSGSVSGQGYSFSWIPASYIDDVHSLNPVVNPPSDTWYVLQAVSDHGCGRTTDSVKVKVYSDIFVPNAFTPNGDGLNDTWNIPALEAYPGSGLTVFNRYGQPVYQSTNTIVSWDGNYKGKPLAAGTYVYHIRLGGNKGDLKGTVVIVR